MPSEMYFSDGICYMDCRVVSQSKKAVKDFSKLDLSRKNYKNYARH